MKLYNNKIIFFLLIFSLNIQAQSSIEERKLLNTIAMLPNWQLGQDYIIEIERKEEQITKENRVVEGFLTAKVKIKINAIKNESYILEWTYVDVNFHSVLPSQEVLFSVKFGISEDLNIRFHLDKRGYFKEIENWQEIQKVVYKQIETFSPNNINKVQLNKLKQQYKAIYATQAQIENIFSKDILLYYGVYGQIYKLGTEKKKNVSLPNALGGEMFPAVLSTKLKELDLVKQEGKVEVLQTTNPRKNQEILYQYFAKVAKSQGKPCPLKDNIPLIELQDESIFYIDTQSHTIHKAQRIRTLQTSNFQKIETTKIKHLNLEQ